MNPSILVVLILLCGNVYAEDLSSFKLFQDFDHGFEVSTFSLDSNIVDWDVMDQTMKKIGAKETGPVYQTGYGNIQFVSLDLGQRHVRFGSNIANKEIALSSFSPEVEKALNERFSEGKAPYGVGFRTMTLEFQGSLATFALSSYLQEKYPEYRKNTDQLVEFKKKDGDTLFWETLLFPASSYFYLADGNPFYHNDYLLTGVLVGMLDGIFIVPAFGGPFFGQGPQEKVTISLIGFAGMAGVRLLCLFANNGELQNYEILRRSGYLIPKTLLP